MTASVDEGAAARPALPGAAAAGPAEPVLVFELCGRRFGMRLAAVEEVLPAVAITPLPKAPDIVEGVIDVRGSVLPVFDLRRRFRCPPKTIEPSDHLILACAGRRRVVVRADRVVAILPASIDDPGIIATGVDYVAGIVRLPDGLVLIHDLATFLSGAENAALDSSLVAS